LPSDPCPPDIGLEGSGLRAVRAIRILLLNHEATSVTTAEPGSDGSVDSRHA